MLSPAAGTKIQLLNGFDDPLISESAWRRLQQQTQTDSVFQTRWWQKTWWEVFGRGQLFLLGVIKGGELVGLAPFYMDGGMIFFIGSGGSDYLDFIGEKFDQSILVDVITMTFKLNPELLGFRLYHVPDESETGSLVKKVAEKLGLACHDEGSLPAPGIDLRYAGKLILGKKKLVQFQRVLERDGELSIGQFSAANDILPRLDRFFAQHVERWSETPYPSQFLDPDQRLFYRALAVAAEPESGLRFTEVCWNDIPIAHHFGFVHGDTYLYYKPSFNIEFQKKSPGMVLLRNVIDEAMKEGVSILDLGLGAESYKDRFANFTRSVRTWGIYPQREFRKPLSSGAGSPK